MYNQDVIRVLLLFLLKNCPFLYDFSSAETQIGFLFSIFTNFCKSVQHFYVEMDRKSHGKDEMQRKRATWMIWPLFLHEIPTALGCRGLPSLKYTSFGLQIQQLRSNHSLHQRIDAPFYSDVANQRLWDWCLCAQSRISSSPEYKWSYFPGFSPACPLYTNK